MLRFIPLLGLLVASAIPASASEPCQGSILKVNVPELAFYSTDTGVAAGKLPASAIPEGTAITACLAKKRVEISVAGKKVWIDRFAVKLSEGKELAAVEKVAPAVGGGRGIPLK